MAATPQAVSPQEERILRRVRTAHKLREFVRLKDGRYYFLPVATGPEDFDVSKGLSASIMRALAAELDRLNTAVTSNVEREYRHGAE
jgi:hypothetical protein